METMSKRPKAIFYDSKNTLFDWTTQWTKASSNILKKYESKLDGSEFQKTWRHFMAAENHRTAFGEYREFTEALQDALVYAFKYHGIPGSPDDVKIMLDLWDEVQPFPDVTAAELNKQKEITKVLIYSNVETKYLEMMVKKLGGFRPDLFLDMQKSRSLKPSPRAYHWVLEKAGLEVKDVLYCAGVQWDVQGSMACGMKAVWINRFQAKLQGVKPDYEVKDLHGVTEVLESSI